MEFNNDNLQKQGAILSAARKVFRQKGFASATVRDIANEAGVNHALINYYFKNKQNLLSAVLKEDFFSALLWLATAVNDPNKTWREMMQSIIDHYTDYLLDDPDSQRFFFNEISIDNTLISTDIPISKMVRGSRLEQELKGLGIDETSAVHLVINTMSLLLSPITTAPLIKTFCGIDDEAFIGIVKDRKKMILPWIEKMYGIK